MQKFIVGLTGPTGSGKSTARQVAEDLGFFCIDADKVARDAVSLGSPLLKTLQTEFGDVLNPDGTLNRAALAEKAFRDKHSTSRLNSIMLPHIVKMIEHIIEGAESTLILLDAPTLFESGYDKSCDITVSIIASKEARTDRIADRDKISLEDAILRTNAQKDDSFYYEKSDYVIVNDKGLDDLKRKAERLICAMGICANTKKHEQ